MGKSCENIEMILNKNICGRDIELYIKDCGYIYNDDFNDTVYWSVQNIDEWYGNKVSFGDGILDKETKSLVIRIPINNISIHHIPLTDEEYKFIFNKIQSNRKSYFKCKDKEILYYMDQEANIDFTPKVVLLKTNYDKGYIQQIVIAKPASLNYKLNNNIPFKLMANYYIIEKVILSIFPPFYKNTQFYGIGCDIYKKKMESINTDELKNIGNNGPSSYLYELNEAAIRSIVNEYRVLILKEKELLNKLLKKSKSTSKKQLMHSYCDACDNKYPCESTSDNIKLYVLPDSKIERIREHLSYNKTQIETYDIENYINNIVGEGKLYNLVNKNILYNVK